MLPRFEKDRLAIKSSSSRLSVGMQRPKGLKSRSGSTGDDGAGGGDVSEKDFGLAQDWGEAGSTLMGDRVGGGGGC